MIELVGACLLTYVVHDSAQDYARTIPRAQRIITEETGIRFMEVDGGPADITYVQHPTGILPNIPATEAGSWAVLGAWVPGTKTVHLTRQVFRSARLPLALHETLHAVGVPHVDDPNSVMSAKLTFSTTFTDADRAAMAGVSCG